MITASIYSTEHGGILRIFTGSEEQLLVQIEENQDWIVGNHVGKRIDLTTFEPVDLYEYELIISTNLVENIPYGATINWITSDDLESGICITGSHEWDVDYPDTAKVTLFHPAYGTTRFEVYCE